MDSSTVFDRREHCRRIASKGGQTTAQRHGRAHMQRIGRRGFEVTTARYFAGQGRLHVAWLVAAGLHAYFSSTGLAMKYAVDGTAVWPETPPTHPAWLVAAGQMGLFEGTAVRYEGLPF